MQLLKTAIAGESNPDVGLWDLGTGLEGLGQLDLEHDTEAGLEAVTSAIMELHILQFGLASGADLAISLERYNTVLAPFGGALNTVGLEGLEEAAVREAYVAQSEIALEGLGDALGRLIEKTKANTRTLWVVAKSTAERLQARISNAQANLKGKGETPVQSSLSVKGWGAFYDPTTGGIKAPSAKAIDTFTEGYLKLSDTSELTGAVSDAIAFLEKEQKEGKLVDKQAALTKTINEHYGLKYVENRNLAKKFGGVLTGYYDVYGESRLLGGITLFGKARKPKGEKIDTIFLNTLDVKVDLDSVKPVTEIDALGGKALADYLKSLENSAEALLTAAKNQRAAMENFNRVAKELKALQGTTKRSKAAMGYAGSVIGTRVGATIGLIKAITAAQAGGGAAAAGGMFAGSMVQLGMLILPYAAAGMVIGAIAGLAILHISVKMLNPIKRVSVQTLKHAAGVLSSHVDYAESCVVNLK